MRLVKVMMIVIAVAVAAAGADKPEPVVEPNQPSGRQGGDTIADALMIQDLPFMDTGTTTGYTHDYDESCPYDGSTSPDVVYAITPQQTMCAVVDLCGSSYDTKVYVYDEELNVVACNDDYYFDDVCGTYVSRIDDAYLLAGETYFIVVDGYGGDHGDYVLDMPYYVSCHVDCPPFAADEGEPPLVDDVIDLYNCGCDCPGPEPLILSLPGDPQGDLVICGTSGWITVDGDVRADSDWFSFVVGESGTVQGGIESTHASTLAVLLPADCAEIEIVQLVEAPACDPVTFEIAGPPGQTVWLRFDGPLYDPPCGGATPQEFNYVLELSGLEAPVATETTSWGRLKSLYH